MPKSRATSATKRRLAFNDDGEQQKNNKSRKTETVDLTHDDPVDEVPANTSSGIISTRSVTPTKKRNYFGTFKHETPADTKTAAVVVTPPDDSSSATPGYKKHKGPASKANNEEEYVPTYIHKNVSYVREGKCKLNQQTEQMFHLVQKYFQIPQNFENNRSFGPLSGSCYEERVISAYMSKQLNPKSEEYAKIEICCNCALEGHLRDDCPQLI